MVDIFVPKDRRLKMKARRVIPSSGQLLLDCKCGCKQWRVHVVIGVGRPSVAELICDTCERRFFVSNNGAIEADGKVNMRRKVNDNY